MIDAAVQTKRASVQTLGCRLNQSESLMIQESLRGDGYDLVPFGEPADLCVINTCTVTAQADAKARNMIRQFARKNPEAFLAVVGCYSQMGYKAIADIDGVDLIIGTQEKLNVLNYAKLGKNESPLVIRDHILRDDFTIQVNGESGYSRRANLKIQDGCDFMCSFCIIPFARGRGRSRDMENLLEEARQLIARGVKELILTGVNVGTYDFEGQDVLDVVNRLNELEGLSRLRISSIEPTTIPSGLFECMNDPEHVLVPYLHIPLQSGSNTVLQTMKRKYSIEEYLDFIRMADTAVQDLCIGTDILVGSAGETAEAFEATCQIFQEGPFAYAHVFTYSEREGTPALNYDGHVPVPERQRRNSVLRKLSEEKRAAYYQRFLGRECEVLFEDPKDGWWPGYTQNYIRVMVRSESDLKNAIHRVRLNELSADFVIGSLVEQV